LIDAERDTPHYHTVTEYYMDTTKNRCRSLSEIAVYFRRQCRDAAVRHADNAGLHAARLCSAPLRR